MNIIWCRKSFQFFYSKSFSFGRKKAGVIKSGFRGFFCLSWFSSVSSCLADGTKKQPKIVSSFLRPIFMFRAIVDYLIF